MFEVGSIWFLPTMSCAVILAAPQRRSLLITLALIMFIVIDLTGLIIFDVMPWTGPLWTGSWKSRKVG